MARCEQARCGIFPGPRPMWRMETGLGAPASAGGGIDLPESQRLHCLSERVCRGAGLWGAAWRLVALEGNSVPVPKAGTLKSVATQSMNGPLPEEPVVQDPQTVPVTKSGAACDQEIPPTAASTTPRHRRTSPCPQVKQLVMERQPLVVRDAKTGEDITRSILLQIILEEEVAARHCSPRRCWPTSSAPMATPCRASWATTWKKTCRSSPTCKPS